MGQLCIATPLFLNQSRWGPWAPAAKQRDRARAAFLHSPALGHRIPGPLAHGTLRLAGS